MRTSRPLITVSVAASAAFLLARPFTTSNWPVIPEVLSIVLLAVIGFRIDRLLGAALAISSVGDFLLGVRQLGRLDAEKLFLLGLGSFLLAHLVYIAMFRKYRLSDWRKPGPVRLLGIVTILVALGSMLGILRDSLGPMIVPVVFYSLVLCGMGVSAMLADLRSPLAAFGALLFISSDAMLAIGKFRGTVPGHDQLIWITYYAAQCLILLGVEHRQKSQQPTP
jgi:uncharacterized membrane protein YhhN